MARLLSVTVDCKNAQRLSMFWALALDGYSADEAGVTVRPESGDGPIIYFQEVPEEKTVKNRVHLDIGTSDIQAEVFRLERNGASVVQKMEQEGHNWVIMADPEGNEFCVSPTS